MLTEPVERNDGIGATHSPEHAGLLEPAADHGLTARLNHARSHEQILLPLWLQCQLQSLPRSQLSKRESPKDTELDIESAGFLPGYAP